MKRWIAYLKTKRKTLLVFFLLTLLLAGSFVLYQLPAAAVLYPAALCLLILLIFLLMDYRRECRRLDEIRQIGASAEDGNTPFPQPETPMEEAYQTILCRMQQVLHEKQAQNRTEYQTMVDYYTTWAHQIKTPLAAMKLAVENEDSALARHLRSELFRTQQYVEMAMTFLRLGADTADYVIKEHSLDALIRNSVRRFAPEFIYRRLSLTYETADGSIITDEKWFSFVLEQLLSNALKYTREGGITISAHDEVLCIADTGIGIAAEDLPRIFEKGFTGGNGRMDHASSGLGLYLCRRICDRLGIGLSIQSEVGRGSCVFLDYAQKRMQNRE